MPASARPFALSSRRARVRLGSAVLVVAFAFATGTAGAAQIVDLGSFLPVAVNSSDVIVGSDAGGTGVWHDGAVTHLQAPGTGGPAAPTDINDAGRISAGYNAQGPDQFTQQAAYWDWPDFATPHALTTLDPAGGNCHCGYSVTYGVNARGDIVGGSRTGPTGGGNRATIWHAGAPGSPVEVGAADLPAGGGYSYGLGIADDDRVLGGWYSTSSGTFHNLLWPDTTHAGTPTNLASNSDLGGVHTISGDGYVVGRSGATAELRAPDGTLTPMGSFFPAAINASHAVVGNDFSQTDDGEISEEWSNGTLIHLSSLLPAGSGWKLSFVTDIAENGDIAGQGTLNGVSHGFLIRRGLTVDDTGDGPDTAPGDGACSDAHLRCTLRAAIMEANAQAPTEALDINFKIPGGGVPAITPATALPALTVPVNLDATTQPGTARERVLVGSKTARLPFGGLDLRGGDSKVKGFDISGFAGAGLKVGGLSRHEGASLQQVSQSVVEHNDVGIEVAAAATTIDGVGFVGNGNLDAAEAFEASLKGKTATPATVQGKLLALGAGIVLRSKAATQLRVVNSVIGGLPAADGPGPAALNQAIGVLVAPTDGPVYGLQIGSAATPNTFLGNALGIVFSAPGPKLSIPGVTGNRFGDDPAGRARMAPFANGVGVLLSGNVTTPRITGNTFRDGVIGILAAGSGVTGLNVATNDLGPNKNFADLEKQLKGGHPSLGDHNLFGVLLADVQGATVAGNRIFGDAIGVLMSGKSSRFNVVSANQIGLSGRPAGRRNTTTIGDFGTGVGIVAQGGEKNIIGGAGGGNDIAAALAGTVVIDESADTLERNIFRDGLYGLVLGGVGGTTTVGGTAAADANTISRNWIGVLQADRELTASEQKVEKLDRAPADAKDRELAFATPYSAAPLNLADSLSTADVSKGLVAFDPEAAARGAKVRYGHNYIGTNAGGGRFGNYLGMGFVGDVRKTLVGIGGGGPNIIGNNHQAGIVMFGHGGHWPKGVSVLGNSIHDNSSLSSPDPLIPGVAGLGIDLTTPIATPEFASQVFGPTPNDPKDADTGPNDLQNYPVLTEAARAPGLSYKGTLESTPKTAFSIEIDSSPFCNPYGYGEGEHVLRSFTQETDGDGVLGFQYEESGVHGRKFHSRLPKHDRYLTATATAPDGSTSEYSACVKVAGTEPPVTVSPGDTGVSPGGETSVEVFNAAAYDVEEVSLKYESLGPGTKAKRTASGAKARRHTVVLAHVRVRVAKHHHKRARLHLTKAARKLLAAKRTLKVTVSVIPARGRHRHATTAKYTLHAPVKKKHAKKG